MSCRVMMALAGCMGLVGAAGPQDPGPLQKSLVDTEPKGEWFYNDLPSGFTAAKKSGKPMLVVFR